MRTLTRLTASASVLLLAFAITACSGASPTASATVPAGPHFDAGMGMGSGNVVQGGGNNVAADSGSAATQRGGSTFGSGN